MSKQLLTQEELQKLKEIKQQVISVASALGEIEYQKVILQIEHERLSTEVKKIKDAEQVILREFGQKYGDGIINLETGEVDLRS